MNSMPTTHSILALILVSILTTSDIFERRSIGADATPLPISSQARSILKRHCHRCHHGDGSVAGTFDVLRFSSLLGITEKKKTLLVSKNVQASYLFERIHKDEMPNDSDPLTDEEKRILREWIDSGLSPYPEAATRSYISITSMLTSIRDTLREANSEDRKYLRFFSLAHLYNDLRIPDEDLRLYRAALIKVVNSLSWKSKLVRPRPIDVKEAMYVIDLRHYDWDHNGQWLEILKAYPYGLKYSNHPDTALQKLDEELTSLSESELPYLNADWFIVTATRPPLYHNILRLPSTEKELEKMLHVDSNLNFERDLILRAGFAKSGVSRQNRLIERHDADYGAYWKSFDFKADNRKGNLIKFPLGPSFDGNPFSEHAFARDGSEMIFHLPNGLQGYFLTDGKGDRIDEGPVDVVNDKAEISGNPTIVNGLSCMVCHKDGMLTNFVDTIREGSSVAGAALKKVQRLHVPHDQIAASIKADQEKYLAAIQSLIGDLIQDSRMAEPIGEVAQLYRLRELDLVRVACELGYEKPDTLFGAIEGNKRLKELGLAPLLKTNGVIKRHDWEQMGATSLYQRVARELNRGTPFRIVQ